MPLGGKKATSQQMSKLLDVIEHNNILRYGKAEPEVKKNEWEKLATEVNAVGGAIKNHEGWKQVYTVWKSKIRAKIRKNENLTESEEKCMKIAGLDVVTRGNQDVPELGFTATPNEDQEGASNVDGTQVPQEVYFEIYEEQELDGEDDPAQEELVAQEANFGGGATRQKLKNKRPQKNPKGKSQLSLY